MTEQSEQNMTDTPATIVAGIGALGYAFPRDQVRAHPGTACPPYRDPFTGLDTVVTGNTGKPRTMRERARMRARMGDPSMSPEPAQYRRLPIAYAITHGVMRRRATCHNVSRGLPVTVLPDDLIGMLYASTINTRGSLSRSRVLPDHAERVAGIDTAQPERVRVFLERVYGHGPSRGMRVVTLGPARDVLGLAIPDAWSVVTDVWLPSPEPEQSRGASHRALTWRAVTDPARARKF